MKVPSAPPAASVASSGVFRMGAVAAGERRSAVSTAELEPVSARAAGPASASSHMKLAPISEDDLPSVAKKRSVEWDDESIEYQLRQTSTLKEQREREARQLRGRPKHRIFWGPEGIAVKLLVWLRSVSDSVYLISVPAMLLLLTAIVLKHRTLANVSTAAVILLNVGRLAIDGFVLVTLAFKGGPIKGVLFFIPPFTFYYLSKRGKVMKDALRRFLNPALPIVGVALLFVFVPWLRGNKKLPSIPIVEKAQERLGEIEGVIKDLPKTLKKTNR